MKKEAPLIKIKNWFISITLSVLIFLGLQGYSNSASLKFVQVSDVHFNTGKINTTYKMLAESSKLLDDAIAQINAIPNVSFVMFTGDQIDKPYEKELSAFLPYTKKLNVPWYFAFGNHDTMVDGYLDPSLYMYLANQYNKNFKFYRTYYSFVPQKGYKVIVLDSIIRETITSQGRIGEAQLTWLDNELKRSQKDTVLIFVHGPIIEPYSSPNHRTVDAEKVEQILRKYKNPIAVFQGHYHAAKVIQKENILYVSCPSLVSYPNAFRVVTVTNQKNQVKFNFEYKETGLKNVQRLSKLLVFGTTVFTGEEEDRNATIVINKGIKK